MGVSINQRGESWQVTITNDGKRERKSFKTFAEAESYADSRKLRIEANAVDVAAPVPKAIREKTARAVNEEAPQDFKALVRYVTETQWDNQAGRRTHVINIGFALRFFGEDYPLHGFTKEAVDAYFKHLKADGSANGTVNRKMTALSVCLKIAHRKQWLANLPHIERLPETGFRDRAITPDEEAKMLAYFERIGRDDLRDAIVILLDTGLRAGVELLELQDTQLALVPFPQVTVIGKGSKQRSVPLTKRALEAVQRRIDAARRAGQRYLFPMSYRTFLERWDGMAAALGLQDDPAFIPHICRHTCASRLADALVPAQQIQKWLGHADITTTMKYVHASAASLQTGVAALERLAPAADSVANVTPFVAATRKSLPQTS